ncbi:sulfatase-like hydrolase/transferase [Maribacter sp. HTCC2170]|uniref:sulfatase-like hydrolase/transferase n=1 Tax=Maribacter sp. (strain HTCC2170 / KCCM 42371) TaxID=313603 RepID=UPI00006BD3EE|nr:sulfatase-like hydrolase/transferase [Maribacter sp. HTCC2170]EAR02294.1 choline sulfatase [Maribacter sp. HTCC2170]
MTKFFNLFLILLVALGCNTESKTHSKKPNIVLIFADDMTYTAINALGNKEIQTPNLDRLVKGGTTFKNAYNMGAWNGAVCVASRAMMISGRSVWNANNFRQNWLEGKEFDKTWGKLMESAGYDTYMTGKWHVDAPADSVFQNVTHVRRGMPWDSWGHGGKIPAINEMIKEGKSKKEIRAIGYNRPLNENDTTWNPVDKKFGGFWVGGKHWSEVLKDDAVGFIDQAKVKDNPFFMYLAFNAPHDPRQAPQEYVDMYSLDKISLPKSWMPMYPYKDSIGNGPGLRDEALAPFPRTEYATKKHIQEYYALISHMDNQIGEILDALENSGKMENTYVIFTADHGLAIGKHGLLGKQSQFDHSIRPPFMIVGPDIPKDASIDKDIYLQDAMATSLDLAGIEKPDYVFFNSIKDLAKGERKESHYKEIYGGYTTTQRMIRKDGYKLIVYPKLKKVLLFNMETDPEEINDLSENPEYQGKINTLFKELLVLQDELNDELDISYVLTQNDN